jgi:hydroxylamine dehydrogenase
MDQFDSVVELFNAKFGRPARDIMAGLYAAELLTPTPFDEPIEFTYWELWHDEGARARHGASMMSPNHAWWEGIYVVGRNFYARFLPEARAVAGERADELVDAVIGAVDSHQWLNDPGQSSPILGFPRDAHEEAE